MNRCVGQGWPAEAAGPQRWQGGVHRHGRDFHGTPRGVQGLLYQVNILHFIGIAREVQGLPVLHQVNTFFGTPRGVQGLLHQANTFIGIAGGVQGLLHQVNAFIGIPKGVQGLLHQVNAFIGIPRVVQGLLHQVNTFIGIAGGWCNKPVCTIQCSIAILRSASFYRQVSKSHSASLS